MKRLILLVLAITAAVAFRLWRYGGRWDMYNETYDKDNIFLGIGIDFKF